MKFRFVNSSTINFEVMINSAAKLLPKVTLLPKLILGKKKLIQIVMTEVVNLFPIHLLLLKVARLHLCHHVPYWFFTIDHRIEEKWEELQIEMGELSETRPQEGSDNTTRREHNSRASC